MGFQIISQRANQFVWFNITIITTTTTSWCTRGSEKLDSSNQVTTHSGTGEKETLNINVVGKKKERRTTNIYIIIIIIILEIKYLKYI